MYSSIAVTTDFSEESRKAFEAAATVAKKLGARLFLLHAAQDPTIVTPWQTAPDAETVKKRRETAQVRLEDLARRDSAFAGTGVDARALSGDSVEAVADFLEREHIDLLVMATHGHSGIKHFLLGSFTAKMLQLAACPVLVFRALREEPAKGVQPFHPVRILVPCDFSRHSRKSLDTARWWANTFDSMVRVLHVVEPLVSPEEGPPGSVQEYFERRTSEASGKLKELSGSHLKGVVSETAVRVGHPAVESLNEAESFGARLIVMSSRGLGVLDRIAMGSVAERVIQGASCPVLVTGRIKP